MWENSVEDDFRLPIDDINQPSSQIRKEKNQYLN